MLVRTRFSQAALSVLIVLLTGLPASVKLRPQVTEKPKKTPSPTARTVQENPKDGLKYVWIPPGTFQMGCSPGDSECLDAEKPSHRVTISEGFWMGQTEVTVGAYKRFVAATDSQMPDAPPYNSGWANDNMAMESASWDDAEAYCTWAGERLPTEAEWEYAARAGSTEARYGPLDEVAWYGKNSGKATHEVAQKRANAFNLYDMLGNVAEWVNDWCDDNYYRSSPERDPQGPDSGQDRVVRGGSRDYDPPSVRVFSRNMLEPTYRSSGLGFRCVREAGGP